MLGSRASEEDLKRFLEGDYGTGPFGESDFDTVMEWARTGSWVDPYNIIFYNTLSVDLGGDDDPSVALLSSAIALILPRGGQRINEELLEDFIGILPKEPFKQRWEILTLLRGNMGDWLFKVSW